MTISARAMPLALTETQSTSSTASPRMAPAMESSSKPSGVVGGSKQEPMEMAGSTPMLMEMGRGLPAFSAFWRKTSR